jgi:hypothetical protein
MTFPSWIHFGMILGGALVLALTALKAKRLCDVKDLIREQHRPRVRRALRFLILLLAFFCLAYLVIGVSLLYSRKLPDAHLVCLVLLGGSSFCWLSMSLTELLLGELQRTLTGILPICGPAKRCGASRAIRRIPRTGRESRPTSGSGPASTSPTASVRTASSGR